MGKVSKQILAEKQNVEEALAIYIGDFVVFNQIKPNHPYAPWFGRTPYSS